MSVREGDRSSGVPATNWHTPTVQLYGSPNAVKFSSTDMNESHHSDGVGDGGVPAADHRRPEGTVHRSRAVGRSPCCDALVPEAMVLIEYTTSTGRLEQYVECPDCGEVVHPR